MKFGDMMDREGLIVMYIATVEPGHVVPTDEDNTCTGGSVVGMTLQRGRHTVTTFWPLYGTAFVTQEFLRESEALP